MARKSGFVRRHGVMRRETLWLGGTSIITTMGSAQAVLISLLSSVGLALRPFTIVRSRGILVARSDQVAALENFDVGYGCAVVTEQASAIGVTAVPTPTTDDFSDAWFVYERLLGSTTSSAVGPQMGWTRDVDSKAMRKVEDGFDFVEVVENPIATGVVISSYVRFLIKLH